MRRRTRRIALAGMMLAIPFATAACQIPIGPCTVTVLEGPTNITCSINL